MELIGRKCIVRSIDAGVFYGMIAEIDRTEVTMTNARCLWYWEGAASLNQLANEGVKRPQNCKFTMACNEIVIFGVCEIIPCTNKAIECIEAVKEWIV